MPRVVRPLIRASASSDKAAGGLMNSNSSKPTAENHYGNFKRLHRPRPVIIGILQFYILSEI